MVDNKDLTVNFLPSPTWNRLGVNRAKIRNIPVDGWNSIPVQKEIIEKYTNNSDSEIWDSFVNIQTGMGEEIDEISKISQSEKIRISAGKTKSEKLFPLVNWSVSLLTGRRRMVSNQFRLHRRTDIKLQ